MKKDIDRDRKNRKKVENGRKTVKNKASGKSKRPVTEIWDFNLDDEIEAQNKSKDAVEAYGEKMPDEPVSLDTGTLELLEVEKLVGKATLKAVSEEAEEGKASARKEQAEEELPARKEHAEAEEEERTVRKKHAEAEEEERTVRKKHAEPEEERPVRKKHTPQEEESPARKKRSAASAHGRGEEKASSGTKERKAAAAAVAGGISEKKTSAKRQGTKKKEAAGKRDRKDETGRKRKKRAGWLEDFSAMDAIIALTGVIVLAVAVFTVRIYTNANTVSGQVDAMAEVGEKMEAIGIAGDSVFLAVADARLAAQEAAELETGFEMPDGTEHYEEKDLQTQVRLGLKLTSIQRDLKIKFTNKESGKLIGNQAFEVRIDGPESMTKTDDDRDGIIYISSIKPGEYTVTVTAPSEIDGNSVAGVSGMVTVKDQIEYKKVDVTDEVKSEAEVNVAKEDTEVKTAVESVLTDTVEWVESSKTPVNGEQITYEEVKKSDIPEPATVAFLESVVSPQIQTAAYFTQEAQERVSADGYSRTVPMRTRGVYFSQTVNRVTIDVQGGKTHTVGDKVTLTANAEMAEGDAEGLEYQWDGGGATIEGSGKSVAVTAESEGTYTVKVDVGGQSAAAEVEFKKKEEPEQPQISSVTVTPESQRAPVGESVPVHVDVQMVSGNYDSISWSASGGDVSGEGTSVTVTGSSAGTVTVTATVKAGTSEQQGTATVEFYQEEAPVVTSVSVKPSSGSATTAQSVELTAEVTMSKGDYTGEVNWRTENGGTLSAQKTSGKSSKVTLSSSAAGKITVIAQAGGQEGRAEVEFTAAEVKVTGITIPSSASVTFNGNISLSASVLPDGASNKAVEWFVSSGTDLISVDQDGKVTAGTKAGTAKVKARAKDGSGTESNECTVTVTSGVSITLEDPGSVKVGEEKELKAAFGGSYNKDSVEWKVADEKIAVIDKKSGKVKGVAVGKVRVTVTVKSSDGKESASSEADLNVVSADAAIVLDPAALTMKTKEKKTVKATVTTTGDKAVEWKSSDETIVKISESKDDSCVVEALKPGKTTVVATSKANREKTASCEITVELADGTALLKDKNGKQLYYKDGDSYKEATAADYYKYDVFYRQKDASQYLYTGWQDIDGKRYYFDKNGVPVTGSQIIQGMQYNFNSDGSLQVNGAMGIDISRHNGDIDWNAVKNAGVNFVILRCGYRGSSSGVLLEDQKFRSNIQGATAAGLKVGIYFFSQAISEVEAVEEASLTLDLIRRYGITYPVFMDVEDANGRADRIDAGTRTKIIRAFCETIRGGGYTAGVYANKTWLNEKMNVGQLSGYKIWLAQYASKPTYGGRYDMWQYSCKGKIPGISTSVDLDMSYMSY